MNEELTLGQLPSERPELADLSAAHQAWMADWAQASTASAQVALIRRWDSAQKRLETWKNLAHIRFARNTEDKEEKGFWDELWPEIAGHNLEVMRAVLASPVRTELQSLLGAHAFGIWEVEVQAFDPSIADDKRAESKLVTQYDTLISGLRAEFGGEKVRLMDLRGKYGDSDRSVRHAARVAQDSAMALASEEIDGIYDALVGLRTEMAKKMGLSSYTPLGYARMGRSDYGPEQVALFRKQLLETVVPLAVKIRARRAKTLGLEGDYRYHDEPVRDHKGVPKPMGGHDWMREQARGMFSALGADFSEFYSLMERRDLMDLEAREGKVSGGFCESLPEHAVPFIFANFNGTQDDVNVFTHECGHAFQCWSAAQTQALRDYGWPTMEACEIHSMGLELLTYNEMERFFGDDAERFRQGHLEDAILFLPYGALVDEFQHEVYARPELSPGERASLWQKLEAKWIPDRSYADTPNFEGGRFWQRQGHLFHMPFYYIDYCLAQVCALQLWSLYLKDPEGTLKTYRALCDLGGSQPFTGLLQTVGLASPFEDGTVAEISALVSERLGL